MKSNQATARGGICDTTALLEGLRQGIFAGLGLDVLEEECFIKEERELLISVFKLINQPNVIITPHNAFNSKEALQRILDTTVENIKAFSVSKPVNLAG